MALISDYDPLWSHHFAAIRDHLAPMLKNGLGLEHIGSTAIPGAVARPIIDCDLVVPRGSMMAAIDALAERGYDHLGDCGLKGREVFRPRPDEIAASLPAHQLFALTADSDILDQHRAFIAYLKAHPQSLQELNDTKRQLIAEFGDDPRRYVVGKSGLIEALVRMATHLG